MRKSIHSLKTLYKEEKITLQEQVSLEPVVEKFSFAITENLYQQIDFDQADDPIAKQFLPSTEELNILAEESVDPIGDQTHQPVKGLVHRYPDRCLLMPIHICAVYCRFCFRREKVGAGSKLMSVSELEAAYHYINTHSNLWEVILTGGDPFFLKPRQLGEIIRNLSAIRHLGVIRVHTRIPMVDPARINTSLLKALQTHLPVYVVIHANHPREFTPQAKEACNKLIAQGIPLLSQSVLLKGINDTIEVLSDLMRCFIRYKIKPYYLHHADLAQGTQHFRTSIQQGQALMRELHGRFSGLCQPTYVLDIPNGYGKSPIGPAYLATIPGFCNAYEIKDYQDHIHFYKDQIESDP